MLFDGYKQHVLRDLDTGLVTAAGITLAELHVDHAYLSSDLVRDRGSDLVIYCKAWRVRNAGGRLAKDQFAIDFTSGQLTCPVGVAMPFEQGKTVRFPKGTCAACPCTPAAPPAATGAA